MASEKVKGRDGKLESSCQDEFCQVNVKDYGFAYLEVRSTLTRKYNDLPRVTLPIFSKFSPSALMLMILKTNQYSSEVLFITWSATMVFSVPKRW